MLWTIAMRRLAKPSIQCSFPAGLQTSLHPPCMRYICRQKDYKKSLFAAVHCPVSVVRSHRFHFVPSCDAGSMLALVLVFLKASLLAWGCAIPDAASVAQHPIQVNGLSGRLTSPVDGWWAAANGGTIS